MGKPLYLGWRDEFSQDGGFIIDEQHHGVLASINSLHYFLQQGHGLEALLPTAKIVLQYLQFLLVHRCHLYISAQNQASI